MVATCRCKQNLLADSCQRAALWQWPSDLSVNTAVHYKMVMASAEVILA